MNELTILIIDRFAETQIDIKGKKKVEHKEYDCANEKTIS